MRKILFVCTGNSCRSVMAEGLLKQLLERRGRTDVQVLSAGTHTLDGIGPTPETVETMLQEGVDVSGHLGKRVTPELIRIADAIFCMEQFHQQQILSMIPEAEGKVHLLKTFENRTPLADPNIPDPIGRPKQVYETCLASIKEAVARVMDWLERP